MNIILPLLDDQHHFKYLFFGYFDPIWFSTYVLFCLHLNVRLSSATSADVVLNSNNLPFYNPLMVCCQ